jgi:hypothetical protein
MRTILFAVLLFFISSTSVHAQADFYKGKTIRLVIGYSAGGTMTSGHGRSRGFGASTFPAIPISSCKICPAPLR